MSGTTVSALDSARADFVKAAEVTGAAIQAGKSYAEISALGNVMTDALRRYAVTDAYGRYQDADSAYAMAAALYGPDSHAAATAGHAAACAYAEYRRTVDDK